MEYSRTYSVWVYLERAEIASAALSGLGGVVGWVKLLKRHCGPLCSSCSVPLSVWLAYTVIVCDFSRPAAHESPSHRCGVPKWSCLQEQALPKRRIWKMLTMRQTNHPLSFSISLLLLTLALLYYYQSFEFYYYDGFIIIVCKICITSHPVGCAEFA